MLNISQTKLVALLQLSYTAGYEKGEDDAGALRTVSAATFDGEVNEFVNKKMRELTQETA